MYHVSAQGIDERMINVHYYYYFCAIFCFRLFTSLPLFLSPLFLFFLSPPFFWVGVKHQDTYLLVPDRLLVHYTGLLCRPGRYGTVHFALRPQKRDGLLGTGTGGEGDERVKARLRIPPEKDRRDRGPPPEQRQC